MAYIMTPIDRGYYSFTDLNNMYLDDIVEVQKFISYNSDIEKSVNKYHSDIAKLEAQ